MLKSEQMRTAKHIFLLYLLFTTLFISCDTQENPFSVGASALFSPNGNEIFMKGISYAIRWHIPDCPEVDIELYKNSELLVTVERELINNGNYEWTVPENIPDGSDYYMQISNAKDHNQYLKSSKGFVIRTSGETSTFTDLRDGQTYKTVKMGDQWWMAENFNYDCGNCAHPYSISDAPSDNYGKLYTHVAAMRYSPEGWHLPSDEEWKQLEAYLGIPSSELDATGSRGVFSANLLKIDGGTGFDIQYGGYHNSCRNSNAHIGWEAHFWTASRTTDDKPIIRVVSESDGRIHRIGTICHDGSSVRYVKD